MKNDTICTTCLRLKQGFCDGEKELTACPSYKQMTNADRIRAMNDGELAKFLCNESSVLCANCDKSEFCNSGQNGYLVWLKQEVKDNA